MKMRVMDVDELSRNLAKINIVSRKMKRGEEVSDEEKREIETLSKKNPGLIREMALEALSRIEGRNREIPRSLRRRTKIGSKKRERAIR